METVSSLTMTGAASVPSNRSPSLFLPEFSELPNEICNTVPAGTSTIRGSGGFGSALEGASAAGEFAAGVDAAGSLVSEDEQAASMDAAANDNTPILSNFIVKILPWIFDSCGGFVANPHT